MDNLQQIAADSSSKAPTLLLLGRPCASTHLMPLLKRTPPACPLVSARFHQMKAAGRVRVEFKPICLAPWPPRPPSGKHPPTLTCSAALYINIYVKTTTKHTVGEAYCLHLMFLALSPLRGEHVMLYQEACSPPTYGPDSCCVQTQRM